MIVLAPGKPLGAAARSDANGHEESDGEKVQQADRRQVLFHLGQRCVGTARCPNSRAGDVRIPRELIEKSHSHDAARQQHPGAFAEDLH